MRGIAGLLIKDPIASISGTHGISHTRMATESANTTNGAHPFPRTLARACGKEPSPQPRTGGSFCVDY